MDQGKKDKLVLYSERGDLKTVSEMILSKGFEVDATNYLGETPLYAASRWNLADLLEFLIMAGANIEGNKMAPSPLKMACGRGYASVVKLLLKNKANVNVTRFSEFTPLMQAVNGCLQAETDEHFDQYIETINHLMEAKADPFIIAMIDKIAHTALQIAKLDSRYHKLSLAKHKVLVQKLEEYEKVMKAEMEAARDTAIEQLMKPEVTFEIDEGSEKESDKESQNELDQNKPAKQGGTKRNKNLCTTF